MAACHGELTRSCFGGEDKIGRSRKPCIWRVSGETIRCNEKYTKNQQKTLFLLTDHDSMSFENKSTATRNINSNFGPGTTQNLPQEELLSGDIRIGSLCGVTMGLPILRGKHG